MRTPLKTLAIATALVAGIAAAPVVFADSKTDTPNTNAFPQGHGAMMGQDHDGVMGKDQAMRPGDVKAMTKAMGQMLAIHGKMMQSMMDAHGATQPGMQPDNN